MNIKYSIVIPTRNKAEYLLYAVKSVLDLSRNDIELIVSDNFSTDGTNELLAKLSDSRLKVIRPSVSLPMAGHYEFAISQASGEWITILGDDDAVMPYIFEALDAHIEKYPHIDIISSARAFYFWTGCEDLYGDLVVGYSSTGKSEIRSTKKDLYAVLAGFRSCFDMPQIYTTAIIKRALYQEIKEKSGGCFYHSIIPDMYSEVAISLARKSYLRVYEPLFWVGTSNKSMGRSDRIYRDAEQFDGDIDGQHPCVPRQISDRVSYLLHSNAFSAMYVYECLLKTPLRRDIHEGNLLRVLVLASVLRETKSRKPNEQIELKNEIWTECNRNGIPIYLVVMISIVLFCVYSVQKISRIPVAIIRRLGLIRGYVRFSSNDRQKFGTILAASAAILNMRVG